MKHGRRSITSTMVGVDCAQRLTCIPPYTVERVEKVKLDLLVYLAEHNINLTPVVMSDLTKLKSLRTLELYLELDDVDISYSEGLLQSSPFFVGLVCEILSEIPVEVEVVWTSWVRNWYAGGTIDADLRYLAHKYRTIKGCNCVSDTSSAAST